MQILLSELSWIWTSRRSNQSFIFSTLTCISGHLLLCKHKLALQYCAPYWLGVITSTKCPLTAGVRNYVTPSVWERMCVRVAAVPTAMLWLKRSRPLHGKVCSHFVLIHDVKLCQSYNYSFKYSSSLICVCVCVCAPSWNWLTAGNLTPRSTLSTHGRCRRSSCTTAKTIWMRRCVNIKLSSLYIYIHHSFSTMEIIHSLYNTHQYSWAQLLSCPQNKEISRLGTVQEVPSHTRYAVQIISACQDMWL